MLFDLLNFFRLKYGWLLDLVIILDMWRGQEAFLDIIHDILYLYSVLLLIWFTAIWVELII